MNNHSSEPYTNIKTNIFFLVFKSEINTSVKITSLFTVFGLIFLLFFYPASFKSSATIVHNGSSMNSSQFASGLISSLGLPGSSGMSSTSPSEISFQILKSHSFANDILFIKFYYPKFDKKIELFKILLDDEKIQIFDKDNKMTNEGREHIYSAKKLFLEESFSVEKNRITNVINFSIVSPEANLSYNIANATIDYLNNRFNEIDIFRSKQKKDFLDIRLKKIEEELLIIEKNYIDFKNQNKLISQSVLLQMQEKDLSRKVDLHTFLLSSLRQQLELVEMEVYDQINELAVISYPEIPAYRDNRRIFLLIGFFVLGLLASIANIFRILLFAEKKT
jgi:uncharacterized protein involved in exopolysaccharide biosynthesis